MAGRDREMLVWVDIEGKCCGGHGWRDVSVGRYRGEMLWRAGMERC